MGPGLLESIYEDCLAYELSQRGLSFERQYPLVITYKGHPVGANLKIDLWVERRVVVELKSLATLLPVHEAQLLTYLRLSGSPVGLLVNFNVLLLRDCIKRMVHHYQTPHSDLGASAPLR